MTRSIAEPKDGDLSIGKDEDNPCGDGQSWSINCITNRAPVRLENYDPGDLSWFSSSKLESNHNLQKKVHNLSNQVDGYFKKLIRYT